LSERRVVQATEVEKMPRDAEAAWADFNERLRRASEVFQARLEEMMEERGVESIEELHERFLATGERIAVPGRHRDKPVKLEEFKRHCAMAYPSVENAWMYPSFFRGIRVALGLSDKEVIELICLATLGEFWPPEEMNA
jgi:hypothetical protein